jgi:hypothetical protein
MTTRKKVITFSNYYYLSNVKQTAIECESFDSTSGALLSYRPSDLAAERCLRAAAMIEPRVEK